jgi:hypothetical protein
MNCDIVADHIGAGTQRIIAKKSLCASFTRVSTVEKIRGLFFCKVTYSNSILWKLISNPAFSSAKNLGFEPLLVFIYF